MLGGGGTGVSTYAQTLVRIARTLPSQLTLLDAGTLRAGPVAQHLRAVRPWSLTARSSRDGFTVPDLFRDAHVHFGLSGRLRTIRLPGPPGVMHWTYPVPIRALGWHNVYTVHDAIPFTHPALTPIDARRHRCVLAALLGDGGRLVTVSADAATRIEQALAPLPAPGGLTNLGSAVAGGHGQPAGALPTDLMPDGYFLAVGSVEPRKNLVRLAAAHARAASALPLVVVGPDGWQGEAIGAALAQRPGVVRLPYQPSAVIREMVAQARALLFPSLAEGFGLPIVEAMARGVPVLTSVGGATAETAGGAALLADPLDEAALAAGIVRLEHDPALLARLRRLGPVRAAAFSEAAFAGRLERFYAGLNGGFG